MKVLVTGGAGFVGSQLALELERQGEDVTILDNFSSGDHRNLLSFKGDIVTGDIRKPEDLGKIEEPDVIFHQAAITDTTIKDENTIFSVNVEGFRNILNYANKNNIDVIYASSAGVYGNGSIPMKENVTAPLNAYSFSKLAMDNLAKKQKDSGLRIVGLRYFNVFGPGEQFKEKTASMIFQLAQQMKEGRPTIFKHGEQKRDHIYVKDVVNANILALKAEESCVVNVGTGNATSFNELINILNEVLSIQQEPEYIDNPYEKDYQTNTQADTAEAQEKIGFKAEYELKAAVKEYLEEIKLV
jgi:ADP-L-glycero-D-manno-heptose 6-epimerase